MNYLKTYIAIIKKARREDRCKGGSTYYERHHIKPKALYPKFTECKWNTVLLTAREHYICHWLLAKIYGKGMWHAFWAMNQQIGKRNRYKSSIGYALCKAEYSKHMKSDLNPQKLNPHNKGKAKDLSHRARISETLKNADRNHLCPHCNKGFTKSGLSCHLAGKACTVRDNYIPRRKGMGKGNYTKTADHKLKISKSLKTYNQGKK